MMLLRTGVCTLLTAFVFLCSAAAAAEPAERAGFDLLIHGGTVVDGTGQPGRRADVGIRDGRIAAAGDLSGSAATVRIDAGKQIVCPGFIDLHSHADRGLIKHPAAENYVRQGVTTLLCGNCGSSPTDLKTFFATLKKTGTGPNVVMLVGHGSVRQQVMGRLNAAPSPEQLDEMKTLVREAMQHGAVGLSTSLRYGPGTYASTDEIVQLVRETAPFGGFYATHMRDEGTRILEAVEEALSIGRQAGVPVHISHHKISSASVFGLTRQTLARIEQARENGQDVTLDQYPYAAGSGGMNLYVPQWSLSGGMDAFRERLNDPETRAKILAGVRELLIRKIYEAGQQPENAEQTAVALARIRVARARHDTALEGKTLVDILRERESPVTLEQGCELLVELILEGTGGINHTLDDRPGGDVDRVMQHPLTSIASDGSVFAFGTGSPHPRSYGCFPRVLGHYVRERKVLSLEQAIHKMTALPAARLGWKDRGRIEPGAWADVVVFDAETIIDRATFAEPHRYATGVSHVLVRGQPVLKAGELTEALPGRPLGRPAAE